MIDEELYQQAADELNSDRRRAHIWARACALSKDDHDEARYLYTNLRVEELMAEREAGMSANAAQSELEDDVTLGLEDDALDLSADNATGELMDDYIEDATLSFHHTASVSGGQSGAAENDALMQELSEISLANKESDADTPVSYQRVEFEQRFDAHANGETPDANQAPVSPMEKEYYEKHPEQLSDRIAHGDEIAIERNNEELNHLLDGVQTPSSDDDSNVSFADFTDATVSESVLVDDELEWLDGETTSEQSQTRLQRVPPPLPAHDDTDRFTQELLRQADELPGQHSDIVASDDNPVEDSTWEPSPRANVAAVGTAAAIGAARYGTHADSNRKRNTTSTTQNGKHTGLPVDLTDGKSGAEFSVYRRDQAVQAVKKGVSWSALLFTLPYLIYRHLFGTAIVYALLAVIVVIGLVFSGLNWMDAGATATTATKVITLGFALLAVIGLLYLPFRHGNFWRSEKLERRGFELVAHVNAASPGRAIALARRASALD